MSYEFNDVGIYKFTNLTIYEFNYLLWLQFLIQT